MWKKILLGLLIVVVLAIAAKDIILKLAVEAGASQALGVDVKISSLNLSVLKQSLRIKGLRVYNPAGFPAGEMINVDDVAVGCNLKDLKKKRIHLTEVVLALREIAVVRNAAGVLNIESINKGQGKAAKAPSGNTGNTGAQKKLSFTFLIDELKFSADKVTFRDLSTKDDKGQELNLKLSMTYTNIDSPQRLTWLIIGDATKAAGVKSAAAYGAKALKDAGIDSNAAQGVIGSLADSLFKK